MAIVFWLSAVAAVYSYTIYPMILWAMISFVRAGNRDVMEAAVPANAAAFTMIVAAHNEEMDIAEKIRQTLPALELHPDSELIVVSDHSSDHTIATASATGHNQVRVLDNEGRRGRAGAHNYAIRFAQNERVIFSDVETRVPSETIAKMTAALGVADVGCINAEIVFANDGHDKVTDAAGLYWRFEMWLRTAETKLKLYATSSGPCMAVRRSLYRDLPPTGDVDFTTPLDVVDAGFLCVHMTGSVAYDVMPVNADSEFKVRIRMVSKNFSGTLSRWGARNILRRPLYTWALYSHKILRWLTPFFLVACLLANLLLVRSGWFYDLTLALQAAFYGMAAAGWIAYRGNRNWPVVQQVYGFVLVNIAFAIGVLKTLVGNVPSFYSPTRQIGN